VEKEEELEVQEKEDHPVNQRIQVLQVHKVLLAQGVVEAAAVEQDLLVRQDLMELMDLMDLMDLMVQLAHLALQGQQDQVEVEAEVVEATQKLSYCSYIIK
jgi:hypothetical protein